MKVEDILLERHQYEDIISNVAKALTKKIAELAMKGELPTRKYEGYGEFYGHGSLGKLKDLAGSKVLSRLFPRLGRVEVEVESSNYTEEGSYGDGRIVLNIAPILTTLRYNPDKVPYSTKVASIAAHEIKHALDDSLSQRRIRDMRFNKFSQQHTTGDDTYLRRQTEINARLSQAAMEIKDRVTALPREEATNETVMNYIILPILYKYDLAKIFLNKESDHPLRGIFQIFGREMITHPSSYPMENKYFRKLLSRMYSYAMSHKAQ